jgi:hypothetical protein
MNHHKENGLLGGGGHADRVPALFAVRVNTVGDNHAILIREDRGGILERDSVFPLVLFVL